MLRFIDRYLGEASPFAELGFRPSKLNCPLNCGLHVHNATITSVMEMSNTIVIETFNNRSSRIGAMEPWEITRGRRIAEARNAKGWSQEDLAREVRVSQVAIQKVEAGGNSKFMSRIFLKLGLDPSGIDPPEGTLPAPTAVFREGPNLYGRNDFPIHAAAEGGPGEIIRNPDPVDWVPRPAPVAHVKEAYGLYVIGESMVPEYRPGDIALINPTLPLIGGEVYIFYAELQGEARATIKHLRRATADKWLVSQHNRPKDFELPRKEWQWAHRVIGKYSRQ